MTAYRPTPIDLDELWREMLQQSFDPAQWFYDNASPNNGGDRVADNEFREDGRRRIARLPSARSASRN